MDSPEDSPPATPVATPQQMVTLRDVTATVASLSLTPSVRRQERSRRKLAHAPRKLFGSPAQVPSSESTSREGSATASPSPWSSQEVRALVTFILLYSEGHSWPSRSNIKEDSFWVEAGQYVQKTVKTKHCRSGVACRVRVFKKLCKEFRSPIEAEQHYSAIDNERSVTQQSSVSQPSSSMSAASLPSLPSSQPVSQVVDQCQVSMGHLGPDDQLNVLSHLFSHLLSQHYEAPQMPGDFLRLVASAVQHTRRCGRSNVIYNLTKALGTMRGDGSDSLLPARRMPMGLIEYTAAFYAASSLNKISCPPDYRMWLQSQYILFGTKFIKFFGGPMWSTERMMQSTGINPVSRSPTDALVNVPSLSERTIRRDIEKSDISVGPQIQVHVLNTASQNLQEARWWIKADGVDVVKGLKESVKGEWSGDVDMNDGSLNALLQEYKGRIEAASTIGLRDRHTLQFIEADLINIQVSLDSDLSFIYDVLSRTNSVYEGSLQSGRHNEKAMLSLLWDLEELKHLNDEGRQLKVDISIALDVIHMPVRLQREHNLAKKLTSIRSTLSAFIKGLYRFKRTPASHIFVVMISSAERNKKPYALPIQCIPYAGMKERDIRTLVNEVVREMVNIGMKVAGFVSNGEFNYLRTKGYTRPLSVLKIRSDARNAYSRAKEDVMLSMLTPLVLPDGTVTAVTYNPAVPVSILREILQWTNDGALRDEVINRLRSRTVPPGYVPHTWSPGKTETFREKLCSILAQFEYQHRIQKWCDKGVDFKTYLYVPEVHPATREIFIEREDDAHVLKRIANHTRSGGPQQLNLQYFQEAYSDPSTNLTLAALTGSRKQSVIDAERFFGQGVASFMQEKGYTYEYKFVETICNWRRSCDERGLSELQRCKFNYKFLNLILDELMPWHRSTYDISLLEVNRPINKVLGFSRETLAAVITNIEGREWLRRSNFIGAAEHPRASTSDDVECFFSMLRDTIGLNFTTKQVFYNFRKVALEFTKRLDPDLPFYYHTSSHNRYHEDPLADFNEASDSGKRRKLSRAPRRETKAFAGRRATLPVQGSLSIRTQFHNQPLELPPLSSTPANITIEHSYSK